MSIIRCNKPIILPSLKIDNVPCNARQLKKFIWWNNNLRSQGIHLSSGCLFRYYSTWSDGYTTCCWHQLYVSENISQIRAQILLKKPTDAAQTIYPGLYFPGVGYVLAGEQKTIEPGGNGATWELDNITEVNWDIDITTENIVDDSYIRIVFAIEDTSINPLVSYNFYELPQKTIETTGTNIIDPALFNTNEALNKDNLLSIWNAIDDIIHTTKNHINQSSIMDMTYFTNWNISDAEWYNVMDTTYTDWNSDAPGYWLHLPVSYHGVVKLNIDSYGVLNASGTVNAKLIDEVGNESSLLTYTDSYAETTGTMYVEIDPDDDLIKLDLVAKNTSGDLDLRIDNFIVNSETQDNLGENTYKLLDDDYIVPSVTNLSPELTINGITQTPDFIYLGSQATIAAWPHYQYGSDLTIAGAGADVSTGQASPFYGSLDGGVLYKDAKYHVASNSVIYDITTQDFIFECVCKVPSTFAALEAICGKYQTNNGYTLAFDTNGKPYLYIKDGTDAASIISTNGYTANSILHIMIVVDYHGYGIIYINGVAAGSAVDISSVDSLTNEGTFSIGNNTSGGSYAFNSIVYYLAMWKRANWLDTHLQADLVKERCAKLQGIYPQLASGTYLPITI